MSNSGTESQCDTAEPARQAEVTPAALAARIAALAGRELPGAAASLPIWDRASRPPRSVWPARMVFFAAWCVTLGLLAVALLRVAAHDAIHLLIWLNAYTLYVYLPAYVLLALAAWRRRRLLAAANIFIVSCHLAWVAPDLRPATPYEGLAAAAADSQPLRIFYANVMSSNSDHQGILREIASIDPDVIVLVEVYRSCHRALAAAAELESYPYGTDLDGQYAGEIVVLSKLPVHRQQSLWSARRVNQLIDIPVGSEMLRLFCLHSPRPLYESPSEYAAFWERIEPILAAQPAPLMVIGDFNATQHSAVHARLTNGRLRSAHIDRGRGYATTWPNGQLPIPPIRIDHALVSREIECVEILEGVGAGSDHKPLVLTLWVHATERKSPPAVAGN